LKSICLNQRLFCQLNALRSVLDREFYFILRTTRTTSVFLYRSVQLLTTFSRKKFGAIVFLVLWSCGHAFPQTRHTVEITRADFTKEAQIVSTELAVFGVMLGDSIPDARAKIEQAGLKLTAPEGRHTIIANDGTELVGIRVDGDKIVLLGLFSAMAKYLAGDSAKLLSDDVTSPGLCGSSPFAWPRGQARCRTQQHRNGRDLQLR